MFQLSGFYCKCGVGCVSFPPRWFHGPKIPLVPNLNLCRPFRIFGALGGVKSYTVIGCCRAHCSAFITWSEEQR